MLCDFHGVDAAKAALEEVHSVLHNFILTVVNVSFSAFKKHVKFLFKGTLTLKAIN